MTIDRSGLPDGVMERAQHAVRAGSQVGRLPRVGDGMRRGVNLLDSLAQLTAVAMDRAALYGELLELQMYGSASEAVRVGYDADGNPPGEPWERSTGDSVADEAIRGLIGVTGTALVVGSGDGAELQFAATGEAMRALAELEGRERDRAADLIVRCVKVGVKLDQVEVMRSYAGTISAALKAVLAELGVPLSDEAVLRAAQRAGLAARRTMGHDDGDPDTRIGPRMSAAERVRALRAALDRAEREAAAEAGTVAVIEGSTGGPG